MTSLVVLAHSQTDSSSSSRKMAKSRGFELVCLLLFSMNLINAASCSRNSNYTEYGMESEKICHPNLMKTSRLSIVRNLAAMVKANHIFDRWKGRMNTVCKFSFKVNKGDGLFAVIQKMSLRGNGSQCLDYVQFKRSDGHYTNKFCGQLDRKKTAFYPVPEPNDGTYAVAPSSMSIYAEFDQIDKSGAEIETEVFISKNDLEPGEYLDLMIVYTPYKDCNKTYNDDYKKIENSTFNTCISKTYFCDGIQNCISNICLDEANCASSTYSVNNSNGTNVTVGAVTTIILVFIISMMCLWICKKRRQLCWSDDCAGPNTSSTRPGALSREPEGSINLPVPTAPMLEVAVTPPVLDKDLPPSYDSLFPPQNNPTTS